MKFCCRLHKLGGYAGDNVRLWSEAKTTASYLLKFMRPGWPASNIFEVPEEFDFEIKAPLLSDVPTKDLRIESTLEELPLYNFEVEIHCPGSAVTKIFEKHPLLPGVILRYGGKFIGMISRQRLLEYLLRPHGIEIFLQEPLSVLYSYARTQVLVLPGKMLVVEAARIALRRTLEFQGEPLVVQTDDNTYQLLNAQELNIAYWQIRGIETQMRFELMQAQIIQSEKMASLGRLVDGVAHEILDPVGFIWGNLSYVSSYAKDLMEVVTTYETLMPEVPAKIVKLKEEIEFDFLQQDLHRTLNSIRTGAERLKKLALGLQNFCHIDEVYAKPADIHACIDGVLLLLKSRISADIEVVKNYGHLPPVPCYAGQLSQVFMNILSNSLDALINQFLTQKFAAEFRDAAFTDLPATATYKPRIEITTSVCNWSQKNRDTEHSRGVMIKISDNGPGMSPQKQRQILESFSTEKRIEKETSLAVSYWIVTAKHGGKFNFESRWRGNGNENDVQASTGTEFEIILPLI